MAATTIAPVHWDMIIGAVKTGCCVPFLGAGVNVSADGYTGLPLGGEVARRLAAKLLDTDAKALEALVTVEAKPPLDKYHDLVQLGLHDLARVALHLEIVGDHTYLVGLLKEILADEGCQPSRMLQALAGLPLKLIVTTNYDRLMEEALNQADKPKPLVVVQPSGGFSVDEQAVWQSKLAKTRKLVLYKIHGSFGGGAGDKPARILISEEDYIEFLTVATAETAGVPPLISSKLVDSILLFLGYSLEDWDFRAIYKALIERLEPRDQRRSFALQKDPPEAWEKYWEKKKVTIYNVDLYEFADELKQRSEVALDS